MLDLESQIELYRIVIAGVLLHGMNAKGVLDKEAIEFVNSEVFKEHIKYRIVVLGQSLNETIAEYKKMNEL